MIYYRFNGLALLQLFNKGDSMKKITSAFLLMLISMSPVLSAESMKLSTRPVSIQSEMLKDKYTGYEVLVSSNIKNPVEISSIKVANIVNNANQVLVDEGLSGVKKNNKYAYLSILTLGLSSFVCLAKNSTVLNKQKEALAEAAIFGTQSSLENMKSEIIMPNKTISFKVLIPVNEEITVDSVFKDTKSGQYIQASLPNL